MRAHASARGSRRGSRGALLLLYFGLLDVVLAFTRVQRVAIQHISLFVSDVLRPIIGPSRGFIDAIPFWEVPADVVLGLGVPLGVVAV